MTCSLHGPVRSGRTGPLYLTGKIMNFLALRCNVSLVLCDNQVMTNTLIARVAVGFPDGDEALFAEMLSAVCLPVVPASDDAELAYGSNTLLFGVVADDALTAVLLIRNFRAHGVPVRVVWAAPGCSLALL